MAEDNRVEQMFDKLAEILTAKELEKLAQKFLAKSSELMSKSKDPSEGNISLRGEETSMVLGNLVNVARPATRTFNENWILDSGASRHVTGTSSEFTSYVPFPPTRKETTQTADGTAQPIRGYLVLIGVAACHGVQIMDILFRTTERAQEIATAINLLPSFIMNSATLVITVQQYPEHFLIMISSLMAVAFNIIEILLLFAVAVIGHFLRAARNTSTDIEAGSRVPSGNGSSGTTSERTELVPYEGIQEQAPVRQLGEHRTRATHGYQQDAAHAIFLSLEGARGCEIFTFRPMSHQNVYTRVILSAPIPPTMINIGCDINIPLLLQALAMFGAEHFTRIRQTEHECRVRSSLFHRRAITDGHRAGTSRAQDNHHQEENTCVIVFQWITGLIITTRITVHYALIRAIFQQIIRRVRVSMQGVTYMVQLLEMNVAGQYIFFIRLLRVPVPHSSRWASSDIFDHNHENPSRFVELDANCSVETG